MALSGTLNFMSASEVGSYTYQYNNDRSYGDDIITSDDTEFIPNDFVGLNSNLNDPMSVSINTLGTTASGYDLTSPASALFPYIGGLLEIGSSDLYAEGIYQYHKVLNGLLHHRNGPYQHPTWKQIRGGNHPLARHFRLNNTMSIDIKRPDPIIKERSLSHQRDKKENYNFIEYDNYIKAENENLSSTAYNSIFYPNLQQYYEPVLTTKHKPLVYRTSMVVGGTTHTIKVRTSLMNQVMDFSSDTLNETLKLSSGDPRVGISQNINYKRTNQKFYNIFRMANKYGEALFTYSERLYPREINSYRGFKLERPAYEEVPGTGSNGYDRFASDRRLFWKDNQGGAGAVYAVGEPPTYFDTVSSSTPSDGTTRLRSVHGAAISYAGDNYKYSPALVQHMNFSSSIVAFPFTVPTTRRAVQHELVKFPSPNTEHYTRSLDNGFKYLIVESVTNGVVVNRYSYHDSKEDGHVVDTLGVLDQRDLYQPYPLALLSSWPLDVRDDVYDNPRYLTSSLGSGFWGGVGGLQIGLTPHKGGAADIADHDGKTLSSTLYSRVQVTGTYAHPGDVAALHVDGVIEALKNLHTGSAGELAYSTKPTIFYASIVTGNIGTDAPSGSFYPGGYRSPTASLQYNRHTFPYNTPFYVTNRVRGRNPFYNSYNDFADNFKYLGRDYSIVPEYRYSEHMDYYNDTYANVFQNLDAPAGLLFKKADGIEAGKEGAAPSAWNASRAKMVRAITFAGVPMELNPVYSAVIHKANFLTLDGADITSSADTQNYSKNTPTDRYKYNDISGATAVDPGASTYTYLGDQTSVNFDGKYATTDFTINFSHLLEIPEGFTEGENSIPSSIKFKCSALKKLLPYNGFYPVVRTTQIGDAFKKEMQQAVGYSGSMSRSGTTSSVGVIPYGQESQSSSYLQALLEPFMAPGLLYNSIKSGIAVDYPIYTSSIDYFLPQLFVSSSTHADSVWHPGSSSFLHHALSSSYHGGLYMMGASNCIPTILTSFPGYRLPFSSLYNWSDMKNIFTPIPQKNIHLVSDFVDLNRSVLASTHEGCMSGNFVTGSPSVVLPNDEGFDSLKTGKYFSMINNFLSETMEFFLADLEPTNTKLPVILTDIFGSGDESKQPIQVQAKNYLMEVSLRMGKYQVMTEGPRDAGIGIGNGAAPHTMTYDDGRSPYFMANSSMRGYIYGPPTEIVPFQALKTGGTTWYPGLSDMTHACIQRGPGGSHDTDFASYFAANLQDPAYHVYTPPYFYGKSSIIYKYSSVNPDTTDLPNFVTKMEDAGVTGSYYVSVYETPTYNTPLPIHRPVHRETISLITPSTGSTSVGARARMKINASLGGISGLMGLYSNPIEISSVTAGTDEVDGPGMHIWTIAPEWICPVLDFSSSIAAVKNNDNSISTITNTFHSIQTGRGLWGGYGTDPYDTILMQEASTAAGFPSQVGPSRKGIYLEVNDFSLDPPIDPQETSLEKEDDEGYYDLLGIDYGANNTASLADLLGIQPKKTKTSYEIGKFADAKKIHEAIVLIPYVDKPIKVPLKSKFVYSAQNIPDTLHYDENTYYATREIIPGKHFLPINEEIFVNTLNLHLLEATNRGHLHEYWGNPDADFSDVDKWSQIKESALDTDVGKMITRLSSFNPDHGGFQLPPEFDFIHNASVAPFQMIVIPFSHSLTKQELIDIYQGIMPDSSLAAKKDYRSFEIKPPSGAQVSDLISSYHIPRFKNVQTSTIYALNADHAAALTSFLSPLPFVNTPYGDAPGGPALVDIDPGNSPYQTSAEFYKNLRFMVFKVKQRAKKDYSNYRKGQIAKAVKTKIQNNINYTFGSSYQNISDSEYNYISKNKTVGDVFGANWPYDYFSLIQTLKIDIAFTDK